jgi:hypothetical protein
MIAVQLSAFRLDENEIARNPVTVLNVVQEVEDDIDVDPAERVDRSYWERKRLIPLTQVDRDFVV